MSTLQPSNLGASSGAPVPDFDRDGLPPAHEAFGKPTPRHETIEMLEPAMLIGLGVVAVWAHLRFPRIRPSSIMCATLRVVCSFGVFAFLPTVLGLLLPLAPPSQWRYVALLLLMPTLTCVLLTWVWLLARILQDLGGRPRGGHPVSTES